MGKSIRSYETFESNKLTENEARTACLWIKESIKELTREINLVVEFQIEDDLEFLQGERATLETVVGKLHRAYKITDQVVAL
ncbi:MAG: hypothetical protein RR382_00700 [Tannerellaceae bacterium]